ncbi:hypothetical protein ABTJ82_19955, partial [Acinetobacter baumannii]
HGARNFGCLAPAVNPKWRDIGHEVARLRQSKLYRTRGAMRQDCRTGVTRRHVRGVLFPNAKG